MPKILIVDDESVLRETLSDWLQKESYNTETAITGEEAIEKNKNNKFDIAIVDLKLPGIDGIEVLRRLKKMNPEMPVIIITAYASIETAVEAMKQGAYDYFVKPFNLEEVSLVIKKIIEHQKLITENIALREQLRERYSFENVIGKSQKMQEIFKLIEAIADSNSTILIQGESGTGKEIIARAIHQRSSRANRPFITVNCAAIPENLLESELFGYEKGAFTGAIQTKKGRFELANGGTLFMDEITDMKPNTQVDLLRVLQEREFRRVGGGKLIPIDVRIITSSNKNIEEEVASGNLREDLYYRLNVISIQLPPLRERREDIPLLVQHFLKKYSKKTNRVIKGMSKEALELFTRYNWPGNVRELENVIERAVILGKDEFLMPNDLPRIIKEVKKDKPHYPPNKSLGEVEKEYITNVLQETGWNLSKTAKTLKINRTTLYNKIKKYKIKK
ncbi:sigma-54-dependent Fis family transcriptional regulator [candidate division WOR-3 bacterium]|nr:sigma-54-dependent Fis family transcriptional regulator [candidate division WOR-3 bacterium]